MASRRIALAWIGLIGLAWAGGCHQIAADLDYVAASIDKWGTISISGATLIEPDPRFELDLNLTGNQIFEANRIEGFSNISQREAFDAQISVRAEIIADMISQMQATTDPKLLDELTKSFKAAAFEGLLGSLPDDQGEQLRSLLKPVTNTIGGGGAGDGESQNPPASDYGDGDLQAGEVALNEAIKAIAEAEAARKKMDESIDGETEDAKKKRKDDLLGEVANQLDAALSSLEKAANQFDAAATAALDAAIDAERRISTLSAEQRSASLKSLDVASDARTAAGAARESAGKLQSNIKAKREAQASAMKGADGDPHEKRADAAIAEAKPLTEATTTELPDTGPQVRDQTLAAVTKGRQAAALAGMPIGPTSPPPPERPKSLTAERIEESRRLGLGAVGKTFKDALSNYDGPLSLNLQQLMTLTASDKQTLEMLRWLSYPRNYGPGQRVFLCMATVNIVPGRQTYRGYYGQVDLYMHYAKQLADPPTKSASQSYASEFTGALGIKSSGTSPSEGQFKLYKRAHPISFAVYPLIDAQVLDLRTSRRRLFATAIQLAITGYPAAADVLLDYASRQEQDVETITGLNAVTSYTTGSHLGFTFAPRLSAQADPSNIHTGPQMALQPQTFPVMLLVICDEKQLSDLQADHVVWTQTVRWRRAPDPSSDAIPLIGRPISEIVYSRASEHEMFERATRLDSISKKLCRLECEYGPNSYTRIYAGARMNELGAKAAPLPVYFGLPLMRDNNDGGFSSVSVHPSQGWVNRPTTFLVKAEDGNKPFDEDYVVTIGGKRVNTTRYSDHVLQATIGPWIETFDFEADPNIGENRRYLANLVVTNGASVVPLCDCGRQGATQSAGRPAGCKCIEFIYYAPTPVTAAKGGPQVDTQFIPPTARVTDDRQSVHADSKDVIRIELSRSLGNASGKLILKGGDKPVVCEMSIKGRSAHSEEIRTASPPATPPAPAQTTAPASGGASAAASAAQAAAESNPSNISEVLGKGELKDMTLELQVPVSGGKVVTISVPVTGAIELKPKK